MWRAAIKGRESKREETRRVSIPRTVCGGLQCHRYGGCSSCPGCFNTENGMWRAAMINPVRNGDVSAAFQYRERYVEGCNPKTCGVIKDFGLVSIPRTVCGGLQFHPVFFWETNADRFQYRERYVEGCNAGVSKERHSNVVVSIPRTVCGGLQYCAPEPLGLLAPDE